MTTPELSRDDALVLKCLRDGEPPRLMNEWEYANVIKSLFDRRLLTAQGMSDVGKDALANWEKAQLTTTSNVAQSTR